MANEDSLLSVIDVPLKVLISFNLLKLLSALATVTGQVSKIQSAMYTFGYNSNKSLLAKSSNIPTKFPLRGDPKTSSDPLKARFLSDRNKAMSVSLSKTFLQKRLEKNIHLAFVDSG